MAYVTANAATIQKKHREWMDNPDNREKCWNGTALNMERRFFYFRANNHCGSGDRDRISQNEFALDLALTLEETAGCLCGYWVAVGQRQSPNLTTLLRRVLVAALPLRTFAGFIGT